MRRLLAILLLLALAGTRISAMPGETEPFSLQQYDNRSGLSNSSINFLFSDRSNLLWVGTWDGLNLYNGSGFHVFNYSRENDSRSIGSNVIQKLSEDRNGNIWITTIEGISRYTKSTGRFSHYFYNQYRRSRVSENEFALAIDTAGNVFCLSQKTGLSRYYAATDQFVPVQLTLQNAQPLVNMAIDAANRLWMLDAGGQLFGFSAATLHPVAGLNPVTNVSQLFPVDGRIFFTNQQNQLMQVDPVSPGTNFLLQLPAPLAMIGFYKNHFFLAWTTRGCGIYNQNFQPDNFLVEQSRQFDQLRLTSFASGTEDILWCGTDGSGLVKLWPKTKPFGTITTSDNGTPYNRSVRSFTEVNGNLWVGTKGNGILVLDNFRQLRDQAPRHFLTAPAALDNNAVYALLKGADDLVYIGTDGRGIGVYDERTQRFYKWSEIKKTTVAEFGSVYSIRQDNDRSLWIGTSGFGLIHLLIDRDNDGLSLRFLERFTYNGGDTGPANDIIYALADGGQDKLWIGCRYGGLSLLDKKTKKFRTFKAFAYEGSLSNNDVLSLFHDRQQRLWIGTSYGLNWLDESSLNTPYPVFQKLTTAEGLPNNTIHAIEQDSLGHIWISSNKGLACINRDGKISFYQQIDGLQSNEFSDGAVWKDNNGYVYFGGIYGFNHFLPSQIARSSWQPRLLVSGLVIGDRRPAGEGYQVIDQNARYETPYTVERNANYFEVDIKALSFLNAEKCEYAYFLSGYDKGWKYTGTNGRINYSNLLPGTYKLWIKWSNGDGAWSSEKMLLSIEVKQYFWLRWYALLLYALLLGSIVYIIYRYRKNRQEIRHQLEVEHLLREKDETAHRSRIGFFTNIAHELQTPLTLIMGSAERFRDKKSSGQNRDGNYFLSIIHQQASKLTYLVHQLLDFRKAEEGFASNHYAFISLSELLQNLAEPFAPLGERNKMEFDIRIEEGISGWTDKDKLEKVIYNLLSNAFKYTGNGEQISFRALRNAADDKLEIEVTNPCDPVSHSELTHLFDQFYTGTQSVKGDKFGTGIGLAFTRQLVDLLYGKIDCRYEQGRIIFSVSLPLQPPAMAAVPAAEQPGTDQPSSLYKAITATDSGPLLAVSPEETNKTALIEQLENKDKQSILLVEDDEDIRFLLKDLLREEYIIHEAADGLEAIGLIEKLIPDLVICDVMMPNMNGLELCNRVKNTSATCHIPFLILSARGSEDHRLEGYEVGADAYIAKPFQASHLQTRVRKLIEYRRKLLHIFSQNETGDNLANSELAAEDRKFLVQLAQLIHTHIAEAELNAVFLEKHFSLSKMQLYRRLKTLTGMTPGEFIKHLRLQEAARLLKTTQLTVTEIFYQTGFNNQSYFFREFRKKYQCAPNEYRTQHSASALRSDEGER